MFSNYNNDEESLCMISDVRMTAAQEMMDLDCLNEGYSIFLNAGDEKFSSQTYLELGDDQVFD